MRKYQVIGIILPGLLLLGGIVIFFSSKPPIPNPASAVEVPTPIRLLEQRGAPPTLPPDATEAVKRGESLFASWCNSCHPSGQAGYGSLDLWGGKPEVSPQLIRDRIRHRNEHERRRFASLTEKQLDDIIVYIQTQQNISKSKN